MQRIKYVYKRTPTRTRYGFRSGRGSRSFVPSDPTGRERTAIVAGGERDELRIGHGVGEVRALGLGLKGQCQCLHSCSLGVELEAAQEKVTFILSSLKTREAGAQPLRFSFTQEWITVPRARPPQRPPAALGAWS